METWSQMNERHIQEKKSFIEKAAKMGLTQSQASTRLMIPPQTICNYIKKHGIDWPRTSSGWGRKGYSKEDYILCAQSDMTKSQAAKHLGVSYNSVAGMQEKYGIRFRDGRKP